MTLLAGDALCPAHGWKSHVFVHEAAHAVAALDREIPFVGVFVYDQATWAKQNETDTLLGGVQIDSDPAAWLRPDPIAALEFVIAGSAAEYELLGDVLPGSHTGDLAVWRRAMGMTDALTNAALDERLGMSFVDVARQKVVSGFGTTGRASRPSRMRSAAAPPLVAHNMRRREVRGR